MAHRGFGKVLRTSEPLNRFVVGPVEEPVEEPVEDSPVGEKIPFFPAQLRGAVPQKRLYCHHECGKYAFFGPRAVGFSHRLG